MANRRQLDVEVGPREGGGNSIYITPHSKDEESGMEGHVGSMDYIISYSHAYEMPGLISYLRSTFLEDVTLAYVDNLAVQPDRGGKGLGSAMMRRMLKEFRVAGAAHVFGHMIEPKGQKRKRLQEWLESFGFEVVECCQEDKLPVIALTL